MSEYKTTGGFVVPPSGGRVIHAYGDTAVFHLTGLETGGKFTLFTDTTPPGGGPPPHYHLAEDETFVVLEGRVSFWKDGQWTEAAPGSVVYIPRGVAHTFKNVGDTPSKILVQTMPSGFEDFFARSEEEFKRPGGPDMARIVSLSAEHGIHYL